MFQDTLGCSRSVHFPSTSERVCPDPWQGTVGAWPGWKEGAVWEDRRRLCWAAGKSTAPKTSPTVPGSLSLEDGSGWERALSIFILVRLSFPFLVHPVTHPNQLARTGLLI